MGLQLSVSFSFSAYDALLAVFAILLLVCFLAIARLPHSSSSRSSSEGVEQPVLRLSDGPLENREETSSSSTVPEEPFVRLTYGQSFAVRDRARALRGPHGRPTAHQEHVEGSQE